MSRRRIGRGLLALGTAAAAVAAVLGATRADGSAPPPKPADVPVVRSVTLLTGDVVEVATRRDGRRSVTMVAGADGRVPQAAVTASGSHLYVVPRSAAALLAAGRLDRALFDVAGLLRQGYGDADRSTLPIVVEYGRGAAAERAASAAALPDARRTGDLSALGAAAFAVPKRDAASFWRGLSDRSAGPAARTDGQLAGGATRIDLDAKVHALVDPDV